MCTEAHNGDCEEVTEARPPRAYTIFGIVVTAASSRSLKWLQEMAERNSPPRIIMFHWRDCLDVDGQPWFIKRSVETHFPFVKLVRLP